MQPNENWVIVSNVRSVFGWWWAFNKNFDHLASQEPNQPLG